MQEENPYAIGSASLAPAFQDAPDDFPLRCVRSGGVGLSRRFQLSGIANGELAWNAWWPVEWVSMDGSQLTTGTSLVEMIYPRFDFRLPSERGPIAMTLQVRACWWFPFKVRGLRIVTGETVVYREGSMDCLPTVAIGP